MLEYDDWGERDPRWAGIRSEWITVQGRQIRVLRADGPEDGTPHLLLHGLGGSATNWIEVIAGLAETGPVVATDLPGFGYTEPSTPIGARVTANATFVPALCAALGWGRIILHGNSMGGMIATMVAASHPVLVAGLVLVDPALPAPRRHSFKMHPLTLLRLGPFAIPRLGQWLMELAWDRRTPAQLFDESAALIYGHPDKVRPAIRDIAVDNYQAGTELDWRIPAFVAAAQSTLAHVAGARKLNRAVNSIVAPTLVLWGEVDKLVLETAIDGLRERRTDWSFHTFPDIGHVPMLETPDEHLAVVRDWLASSGLVAVEAAA